MSSDDVKITERGDGALSVRSAGNGGSIIYPVEVAALRARFAAERMPEDVKKLVDEAREVMRATRDTAREVVEVGAEINDDADRAALASDLKMLADLIDRLTDALEAAQHPPVGSEVREALDELIADVLIAERDEWPRDPGDAPSEVLAGAVTDALLARFSVPSQPVYDEEKIAEVIARALTGFDLHMQAGVPSHTYVGRYEAVQLSREAAAALVAALRGGELTREETKG